MIDSCICRGDDSIGEKLYYISQENTVPVAKYSRGENSVSIVPLIKTVCPSMSNVFRQNP